LKLQGILSRVKLEILKVLRITVTLAGEDGEGGDQRVLNTS
jgi:hypothetical protein